MSRKWYLDAVGGGDVDSPAAVRTRARPGGAMPVGASSRRRSAGRPAGCLGAAVMVARRNARSRRCRCARRLARRRLASALALLAAVLLGAPSGLRADHEDGSEQPRSLAEYQLKAAYLYRLTSFIEWPEQVWPADGQPFYACVLGADPFGAYIDYFDGKTVRGRRFTVRRLEAAEDLESGPACHLIFVSVEDGTELDDVLPARLREHVLTVGEGRAFAAQGGVIGFVLAKRHVGLAVNVAAGRDAGLVISSKLLDMAAIVEGEER